MPQPVQCLAIPSFPLSAPQTYLPAWIVVALNVVLEYLHSHPRRGSGVSVLRHRSSPVGLDLAVQCPDVVKVTAVRQQPHLVSPPRRPLPLESGQVRRGRIHWVG
uniref:Uncharacterized protein n=1 Tax=Peronospora matthiolae TaxID=2874970 RepID=A0AAV1TCA3_9STRA